jgi:hypothetical protein
MDDQLTPMDDIDLPPQHVGRSFSWSYYLWRSGHDDYVKLAVWRTQLIRWLSQFYDGPPLKLGIGWCYGSEKPAMVERVGYRIVAFLEESASPDDVVSCLAVSEIIRLATNETNAKVSNYDSIP